MEHLCKTSVVDTERGPLYFVEEPLLSADGARMMRDVRTDVYTILGPVQATFDEAKLRGFIDYAISESEAEHNFRLPQNDRPKVRYYLERDLVHLGRLEPLLADKDVKEIECTGANMPLLVDHKRGKMDSNVLFTTRDQLKEMMLRLAFLARIPLKAGAKGTVEGHELQFTKLKDQIGFKVNKK